MNLLILHLSDIHIKDESNEILYFDELIAKTLYSHIDENCHLIILISGDIAFSGNELEYDLAYDFLNSIKDNIKKEQDITVNFITCPGNHDCHFSENPTRDFILDKLSSENLIEIDRSVLDSCITHQNGFFNFRDKLENGSEDEDKLWRTTKIEFGGKNIVFESLNYSWSSTLKEKQGRILFPFSLYKQKIKEKADIRISLMHHPLNWLNQSAYREFRVNLRSISDFIFTGHEHAANAINHEDVESGDTVIIEGGVLQEKDISTSSFGLVKINLETNINTYIKYEFSSCENMYLPSDEKTLISVKENKGKQFQFTQMFSQKIEDCGGYFKHGNKVNLKLSDIYVYPNIIKKSNDEYQLHAVSSKTILQENKFGNGVILSGDDNIGSTSLIYILISEYFSNGYIPLLIHGSNIKKSTHDNVALQIERAIYQQYEGNKSKNIFDQESKSKKILFIDDFDEIKLKSETAKKEILKYLMSKFHKIIVTVDSMYEVGDLISTEDNSILDSFEHYKIEPFGYKKRTELIQKWYALGQLDSEDESEIIGKCNTAEKLMDSVMDKSLITLHPIFLLTFLQGIETDNSNQLSDSALGHYYKYLLTQSFLDIGINTDKLGSELDYAMHLARFFNERKTLSITEEEFIKFNAVFSETWHETKFEKKEKTLLNAKVLIKTNGEYQFRYMYNYYYLIGLYLSQNILDSEIQKEISHCIVHLYLKNNANTILFLAHHTTSDNILFMMKNAADELFNHNNPADFSDSCSVANELIKHAPQLEFNNNSPKENRKEISEHRDNIERNNQVDHNVEEEQDSNHLDLTAKLTMLFKTIDILSQIIKSNPTKFERNKKVEILKTIINAPLRALQDFYNLLEEHPQSLIEAINHEIDNKSNIVSETEREQIARIVASRLIQFASSTFIIKTAEIINSEMLMPDIPTAIEENENLALKLIDIAISVDNHLPLKRRKIKLVHDKCDSNVVAKKILDVIMLNRLNMYKTTEQDMQWLHSELNYDLKIQHKIGYDQSRKLTKA